jgi:uncharacterized protein YciI
MDRNHYIYILRLIPRLQETVNWTQEDNAVVLEAENEAQAQGLMKSDPAVRKGVMTASLFPFNVALIRQ